MRSQSGKPRADGSAARDDRYSNHYTDWLIEERLPSIDNPNRRIGEALARRGFLLGHDDSRVVLRKGAHEDDFTTVSKRLDAFGLKLRLLQSDPELIADIDISLQCDLDTLTKEIVLLPSIRGMSQSFRKSESWFGFVNNTWGQQVPARDLDLGIAPLVKAFPYAGIRSILCCDGHGSRPATVDFCGPYYRLWCQAIVEEVISPALLTKDAQWSFEKAQLRIVPVNEDWDQLAGMFEEVFRVAQLFASKAAIDFFQRAKAEAIEKLDSESRRRLNATEGEEAISLAFREALRAGLAHSPAFCEWQKAILSEKDPRACSRQKLSA